MVGKRGAKQNPYSQDKLLVEVLNNGGSFTELDLGKIIFGKCKRGVRSLIAVARREGYLIADEIVINSKTGRKNKSYYMETNEIKFYKWAKKSGAFNFKPGAPTY